jgi:hypothetical protein
VKLTELEPRWLEIDGRRVGIMLLCPHCVAEKRAKPTPLSCFFIPTEHISGDDYHDSQYGLFAHLLPTFGEAYAGQEPNDVVPCRRGFAWQRVGDDFASMSITPSLDASASGHWHGFITNGNAT